MKLWSAFIASALMAASALVASSPSVDQVRSQRVDHQSGPFLFRAFCSSCHGESGKGDGPVADLLKQRPPDLGRIALRAGGVFPRDTVMRKIDGRTPVRAHGGDMPIWGDTLKTTEGQDERVIKQRIDALTSHIESLQVK